MMIKHSKETGNTIFHIALSPDGTLQPIINVPLLFSDSQLLAHLLNTDNIRCMTAEIGSDKYLFLADGNSEQPYPSVMIWKYIVEDNDQVFVDVNQNDFKAIDFAIEHYLH